MKYSFKNDYSTLCNKEIIDELSRMSNEQYDGYGLSTYDFEAKELIKKEIEADVDIHFMVGGTNVNKTVLMHILKPYECVVSCDTGHINVHETGAVENTGHKIFAVKNHLSKMTIEELDKAIKMHVDEHMVKPKVVFISDATEYGMIYQKKELKALYEYCQQNDLYLYLDGARLASALTSNTNDLTLNDIANYTDVFYIGGTKSGAMLGEALVIKNPNIKTNFRYSLKAAGGMLAKGFLIAAQYKVLFTNDLYYKNGRHENELASKIRKAFQNLGYDLYVKNDTNQIFVCMSEPQFLKIKSFYDCMIFDRIKDKVVVRFVISFDTSEKVVDEFINYLKTI